MKKWLFPQIETSRVQALAQQLDMEVLLASVLVQRGITDTTLAQQFFDPNLNDLHDPFLLTDMDKAVRRLNRAIIAKERVLLYGDYDVDGTTSVAMMFAFLRNFYTNIDYYLPDRDKEGYGISTTGIEYARETGVQLIIAMDCGIKDNTSIALAAQYGIDTIVCDHHVPEGDLPPACAVLNPKRSDCAYPYKDLSGCGIAFKLAQGYALYNATPAQELAGLLDFVALSIACDIVPITGENRILAHFGLEKINRAPRLGLWALINKSGRVYPLSISDLVFGLGPMINAAGRLGDARESVRLMLSVDRNSALDAAGHLVQRNRQRQAVDLTATAKAREMAQQTVAEHNPGTLVLFHPDWHKGIVGITASRISEDFHRPTVILTESEGRAVGSARSVPGFDLYAAMQTCEHLFYSFGGHEHAVGLQMPLDNIEAFRTQLELYAQHHNTLARLEPALDIAGEIQLSQITPAFFKQLNRFGPFGPGNMNPVFVARQVVDTGKSKRLANNHVRLSIRQEDTTISAIGFGLAEAFEQVRHRPFDIAFNLREEQWQGNTIVSLQLKDVF